MGYVVSGLDPTPFRRFYCLAEDTLAAAGIIRMMADAKPGFPCRITLDDAEPGEPCCCSIRAARFVDVVPEQLATRLLSVRAFDTGGMMTDADVVEGRALEPLIARLFNDPAVAYVRAHNARRGCFAARIDRAQAKVRKAWASARRPVR